MKHTKFKTNKLTTAACTKHSRKRQDFKKGFQVGWSTMLHEKCCNTVLQIGAPQTLIILDWRPRLEKNKGENNVTHVGSLYSEALL